MARPDFAKLIAGLGLVFLGFQWAATLLESDRGQAGLLIALLVIAGLLVVERLFFGQPLAASWRVLGLGRPQGRGMLTAVALGLLLLSVIPLYAHFTPASVQFRRDWVWLLPGLFAQAGVAEEALFRGYLFGHLRRQHPFWRAARLSMIPFVIVHLLMFVTLPWPIAAAAMLLAVAISFPLAHLFELAGATIWAPALAHFVVQGALKVIVVSGEPSATLPLVWMAASATIPWLVFLAPRRSPHEPADAAASRD
jgi:membrane protease YdiL (CAAX protease family)